ncbi:MAG TPA: DUF488 family protein [Burkholderiales bacterium]|nr:DUF488 family protein [Burkholderiales bacterium]
MIRIVRLGNPRGRGEGLRIGAARRPPRGVKKKDYARLNYYDVWLPELAPSQKVVSWALSQPFTDERWAKFERDYRREMAKPHAARLLELLARLSHHADFSLGCYCEDERRCHRSILRTLLAEHGARIF